MHHSAFLSSNAPCVYHSPHAPPPLRCPQVWFARSLPLEAAGLPTEALMNSCYSESPSLPGHCHSNHRPVVGSLPRRSPGEGSPAENRQKHTHNMRLIIQYS